MTGSLHPSFTISDDSRYEISIDHNPVYEPSPNPIYDTASSSSQPGFNNAANPIYYKNVKKQTEGDSYDTLRQSTTQPALSSSPGYSHLGQNILANDNTYDHLGMNTVKSPPPTSNEYSHLDHIRTDTAKSKPSIVTDYANVDQNEIQAKQNIKIYDNPQPAYDHLDHQGTLSNVRERLSSFGNNNPYSRLSHTSSATEETLYAEAQQPELSDLKQ